MSDEPRDADVVPLLSRRPEPEQPRRRGAANGSSKAGKLAAAERRHAIIQATLAGFDHEQIARQVGVTPATVSRTLAKVMERWENDDQRSVQQLREMQVRRLERLVTAVWSEAIGSTKDGVRRPPNLKAVAEIRNLTLAQARLAGTEAPKKLEVSGEIGIALSMDELTDLDAAWSASGGDTIEGSIAELGSGA